MPLPSFIDFVLHIDKHLSTLIQTYGVGTYLILFLIVFCKTGLVVTPFLPGHSLLFASGAFAAQGVLNFGILVALLVFASIAGDSANFSIGRHIGKKLERNEKLVNPHYIKHTQEFYKKYGSKTIVLARFVPIVRTFAPFVAGIGRMNYSQFMFYNVIGGIIWVGLFTTAGYLFGNIPWVQDNFGIVVIGIIIASIIPAVVEFVRHRKNNSLKFEN